MADLTILRDAAGAYCASMTTQEWEAFAASVRDPSETEAAPTDPGAKKARATAAFRRAGKGTSA